MHYMQRLRNAHLLARLVLVWFTLSIGVAIASPLIKPLSVQLVCSASGAVKTIDEAGDDDTGALRNTLDCPLCAAVSAPPSQSSIQSLASTSLLTVLQLRPDTQQPRRPAAPFPPRGPPALV